MRTMVICILFALLVMPAAHADVRLHGNLNIMDSTVGAVFLGEVANDTDDPITTVMVRVTAKNASGEVIDEPWGYIDGFRDPESGGEYYILPGHFAPFKFFGDVDADEIVSYEVSITYEVTDAVHPDLGDVTRISGTNYVSTSLGTTFFGEIRNNSPNYVYFVQITMGLRDNDGNVIDVDYTYVEGEDFRHSENIYTDTLIQPGETAPFELITFTDTSDISSFYTIITYHVGEAGRYDYYGENDVTLADEMTKSEFAGYVKFSSEMVNNTARDLYYAGVTVVSRNSENKIIGIDHGYVDGTPYDITDTVNTDSHIAPGSSAPIEILAIVDYDDVASFEYFITYRYAGEITGIEHTAPLAFILDQNYPNPFNPATTISFTLLEAADVRLMVYNSTGQLVSELIDARLGVGSHSTVWDGSDYASGIYIYTLTSGSRSIQRKMSLVK